MFPSSLSQLPNWLRKLIDAVRPMVESRHQTLTNSLPEELPSIWVDVDMIRRVLINLLENASKFIPPDGKIELGARRDGEWMQMWVQDDGPGIPFADQERIFDKFTRLKEEGAPSGLGVGLAFCRLAVEGHGGKIWVESQTWSRGQIHPHSATCKRRIKKHLLKWELFGLQLAMRIYLPAQDC